MEIKAFLKTSFVDWDGKIVSVIWLPKCNFRCQWCYDRDLVLEYEKMPNVPFEEIKDYILKYKKFIDGLVITGGEPTLRRDLFEIISGCSDLESLDEVQLVTNGSL